MEFKVGDMYTYEDSFCRGTPITVEIVEVYDIPSVLLKILEECPEYRGVGRICKFGTNVGTWTKTSQLKYPRITTKFLEGLQI